MQSTAITLPRFICRNLHMLLNRSSPAKHGAGVPGVEHDTRRLYAWRTEYAYLIMLRQTTPGVMGIWRKTRQQYRPKGDTHHHVKNGHPALYSVW